MALDLNALIDRVQCLEVELSAYKQHHRRCILARQLSPPPDDNDCTGSLRIVEFQGPICEKKHTRLGNKNSEPTEITDKRYLSERSSLLQGVPDAKRWISAKSQLKLPSNSIISYILGVPFSSQTSIEPEPDPDASSLTIPNGGSTELILLTKRFASLTKRTTRCADTSSLLRKYQELVFVSLCVVLQHHGVEINQINSAMRLCISNSKDDNLDMLRNGAKWANETIVALEDTGLWGNRVGEAFFLCGFSTSKYIRLAQQKTSRKEIVSGLSDPKYFSEKVKELAHTPFSIPAFISVIVQERLTLEEICTALGYKSIGAIRETRSEYVKILNSARPYTKISNKKRKLVETQVSQLDWDTINFNSDCNITWEELLFEFEEQEDDERVVEEIEDPYMGAVDGAEDDGTLPM